MFDSTQSGQRPDVSLEDAMALAISPRGEAMIWGTDGRAFVMRFMVKLETLWFVWQREQRSEETGKLGNFGQVGGKAGGKAGLVVWRLPTAHSKQSVQHQTPGQANAIAGRSASRGYAGSQ